MKATINSILILLLFVISGSINAQSVSNQNKEKSSEWSEKGAVLLIKGNYSESIKCFEKAIKYNPESSYPYTNWGIALFQPALIKEDSVGIKNAIEKFKIAETFSSDKVKGKNYIIIATAALARITKNKARYKEVLQLYAELEKDAGPLSYFYNNWATTLTGYCTMNNTLAENEERIAILFHKAIRTDKNAMYNLACLYSLLNKPQQAVKWLDEALLSDPDKYTKTAIDSDSDFDNIRENVEFKSLKNRHFQAELETNTEEEVNGYTTERGDYNYEQPFTVVEKMPSFPGGQKALMSFIKDNIKLPEEAIKYGIQRRMLLRFVVSKDGTIKDIQVIKPTYKSPDLSKPYDSEAIRVVKMFPQWIPGEQNERPVPVYFTLPITFSAEPTIGN